MGFYAKMPNGGYMGDPGMEWMTTSDYVIGPTPLPGGGYDKTKLRRIYTPGVHQTLKHDNPESLPWDHEANQRVAAESNQVYQGGGWQVPEQLPGSGGSQRKTSSGSYSRGGPRRTVGQSFLGGSSNMGGSGITRNKLLGQ